MNAPGLDPLTKLWQGVKASERMRGVAVEFGSREDPEECSPARIVMVPVGGPLQSPDHSGNVSDAAISLACRCFARDFSALHEVIRRLLCAVDDYTTEVGDNPADETADGVADCIRFAGGEIEYDTERDTNRQGFFAQVTLELILSFEHTDRSTDGGFGTVEDVQIEPA